MLRAASSARMVPTWLCAPAAWITSREGWSSSVGDVSGLLARAAREWPLAPLIMGMLGRPDGVCSQGLPITPTSQM